MTVRLKDPLNPTLEEAVAIVKGLVRDFTDDATYCLSKSYQEAEVRKDFIDKLLIALGWDVNHEIQKNPFQQEVKVERTVQVATAQRRSDYARSLAPSFDSPILYVEARTVQTSTLPRFTIGRSTPHSWKLARDYGILRRLEIMTKRRFTCRSDVT